MGDKTSVRHCCTEAVTPYENNSISFQQSSPILEENLKVHLTEMKDLPSSLINRQQNPDNQATNFSLLLTSGFHWSLTETTALGAQCMWAS